MPNFWRKFEVKLSKMQILFKSELKAYDKDISSKALIINIANILFFILIQFKIISVKNKNKFFIAL